MSLASLTLWPRQLDAAATSCSTKRYSSTSTNEAWQIAQIEEGLRDLEAGNVVPDDEMEAFWGRITTPEGMERACAEARQLYP